MKMVFLIVIFVGLSQTSFVLNRALRKKCPYSELFWSVFSRIWTEYEEIRSIKIRTRITPNTDTFYAVTVVKFVQIKQSRCMVPKYTNFSVLYYFE